MEATSSAAGTQQLVVFALAGEEYGVPIARVQEIIDYTEPRSVASDTDWICGVIGLRGRIIPVYDLAARLRLERTHDDHAKIVIVDTAGSLAGIVVDNVSEVLTVDAEALDEAPGVSGGSVEAIAKLDDRLIVLLDLDATFDNAEPVAAA
ncbi:MAG TPA: chemotaxis protein CheW [Solirubrobacteraceae bacterium]|jgi:purine-binding chemotaxis protein CheW|nr:chemotaxis protein CheW [Solirubrobacteraceae bacterium]